MDTLVQFHIDESERAEAADICTALGIDLPSYLRMCTSRLVRERGIPFRMHLNDIGSVKEPKTLDTLTAAELNAKLEHSCNQSLADEGRPLDDVFDELRRGLGSNGFV